MQTKILDIRDSLTGDATPGHMNLFTKCVNNWLLESLFYGTHHPLQNFSKDDMFAIQPRSHDGSDEELGTVGVLASIGHAEPAGAVMLQLEVLIGEAVAIDALS